MAAISTDWKDKKMFLTEMTDALSIQCTKLNIASSSKSQTIKKKSVSNNVNPKKNKGKKKKQMKVDKENATSTDASNAESNCSMPPIARGGATLTFLPSTKQLLVLGGADRVGEEYGFRKVGLFNLETNAWSLDTLATGAAPGPRNGHTSTLIADRWLYVFGGLHISSETCFNEIYCLDIKTMVWTKFDLNSTGTSKQRPRPRNGHTACHVAVSTDSSKASIYYFGGSSPAQGLMNDMCILDINIPVVPTTSGTNDNEQGIVEIAAPQWRANCQKDVIQGTPPSPRESHTCVASNNTLYVYGGRSETAVNSDIISFDLLTNTWGTVQNTKMPNMAHNMVAFSNGRHLGMYGGCDGTKLLNTFYFYNIAMNMWTEPKMNGDIPSESMACCLASSSTTTIAKKEIKEDQEKVDDEKKTEGMEGMEKKKDVVVEERLYIFGGSTMRKDLNDLFTIVVPTLPSIEDEKIDSDGSEPVVTSSNKVPKDAKKRTVTRHVKTKGASSAR